MMGSKPNNWETAAPGPHRLTLWNKTIHFLFGEAWEELLAAVLFGNFSAEVGNREGFQRHQMQFYPNIHAHVHSEPFPLYLHNGWSKHFYSGNGTHCVTLALPQHWIKAKVFTNCPQKAVTDAENTSYIILLGLHQHRSPRSADISIYPLQWLYTKKIN